MTLGQCRQNSKKKASFNLSLNRIGDFLLIKKQLIQDTMRRTMNAEILHDYLSSAHMTVMLCRAHGENFFLDPEEIADANWRIELHIAELEDLRNELTLRNIAPKVVDRSNIIRLPVAAR